MKKEDTLSDALIKSYIARAKLFYSVLKKKNLTKLFSRVEECAANEVSWGSPQLGISREAFSIVQRISINPALVFCHPLILAACPEIIEYYRNIAALSQKGLSQILSGKLPRSSKVNNETRLQVISKILNQLISSIIIDTEGFSLSSAREALIAEVGTEIQGTWVNIIGKGAAKAVEGIIYDYAREKGFFESLEKKAAIIKGKSHKQTHIMLKNRWRIIFSHEPDVSIRDAKDKLIAAIEIKGSMDKAGAQTRLGEAKKSFAKAKSENAHCVTIYLASCFTEAVYAQLKTDREIDMHFNLVDILAAEKKKQRFLNELFHYLIRIQ